MWIYLGALLLALTPLLWGASSFKRRLDANDRSTRNAMSEGSFAASGQRTMQQITDAHIDIITYLLVVGLAFIYPVGVLKLETLLTGADGNVLVPLLFAAATLLWSGFRLHQTLRNANRLRTTLIADLEVGNHVNHLMQQGYYVFHDVPGDGFHIDHLAVGHNGVFVIAADGRHQPSKSGTGRQVSFENGWLCYPQIDDVSAIVEVRGKVAWLGTWLSRRLGRPCHPTPVLCLPGWHVELKTTPTFPILNQKYLSWTLPGWQGESLDEDEIQRVCNLIRERVTRHLDSELAEAA